MSDNRTTRIEDVLSGVREEVARRRAHGRYAEGYESEVEGSHNTELGKTRLSGGSDVEELVRLLATLRANIEQITDAERDTSRFAPIRYVRELAMSRHQVIRLTEDVRAIAESIESIARQIVESENARTLETMRAANETLDVVVGRTVAFERLAGAYDEIAERLERLEKNLSS